MATDAQIEANRRNAMLSTGPRTPEGKDVSRRNALKHGLAGAGDVLHDDDFGLVAERTDAYRASLRPADACGETLVAQMAVDAIRMERCRQAYVVLVNDHARRARLCWDADRRLDAEETAAGLARDPQRVARRLEATLHGCDLVAERWGDLRRILTETGDWTDAQRSLALDLLGVPPVLRDGRTPVDPPEGDPAAAFRLALADAQLARLERLRTGPLGAIDEAERRTAETGLGAELSAPVRLLDRYESACHRRWRAGLRHLTGPRPERPADGPSPSHAPPRFDRYYPPPPPEPVTKPAAPPPPPPPALPIRMAAPEPAPAPGPAIASPPPPAPPRNFSRKQRRYLARLQGGKA